MAWRNCEASNTLRAEVNHRWVVRDRASDGTIGDAAHASRASDHNPWVKDPNGVGVVRALDIDEDLDGVTADTGADAKLLFDHLLALARAGDPRINGGGYLIYERMIYSEKGNWAGRAYYGVNAHKKHVHISFSRNRAGYDSTRPWGISQIGPTPPATPPEESFMQELSDNEQRQMYLWLANLDEQYGQKGKGVRQVIAKIDKRTSTIEKWVRDLFGWYKK